ncbi:MAG: ChbG/HpnK family deacetylase [Magnetospirillum sp. WYHS-4]
MSLVPFTLSADDYGLAPGIGLAIRDLILRERLPATGCMVGGPFWPEEAARLRPLAGRCDVGLHLTLTDQAPCGPLPRLAPDGRLPPLGELLRQALLRRLDVAEVRTEIGRQVDRFEEFFGAPPAFVDGHHHVHVLPGIREVLADVYERRLRRTGTRVRRCTQPLADILRVGVAVRRSLVIAALGDAWTRRSLAAGMPGNRHFRGVRDFLPSESYPDLCAAWLKGLRPGTLVMCHPGLVDEALRAVETLTDRREEEYAFLKSEAFQDLLARSGTRPVRLSELE